MYDIIYLALFKIPLNHITPTKIVIKIILKTIQLDIMFFYVLL